MRGGNIQLGGKDKKGRQTVREENELDSSF